jgi:translation initiation factor 2 subunit 3
VPLVYAIAGGLIGVGTTLDPSLTRQNKMAGQVLGEPSSMPPIFSELEMQFTLLPQVLGAKDAGGAAAAASSTGGVDSLRLEEKLQVNVGSITTLGTVKAVTPNAARLVLSKPMCASPGDSVAFSRKIGESWRLIGWGSIRRGVSMKVDPFL